MSKLIGSPPGYVGYEEGGQLTEALRRHPYASCCSMRLKKPTAMCSIFFLQIFDDGRLTDSKGQNDQLQKCSLHHDLQLGVCGASRG